MQRHVMHVFEHVVVFREGRATSRKNAFDAVTGEDLLERQAGEHRAGGKDAERNQHHHRALVRSRQCWRSCGSPWKVLKISRQE